MARGGGGVLLERVRRILSPESPDPAVPRGRALLFGLLLAVPLLALPRVTSPVSVRTAVFVEQVEGGPGASERADGRGVRTATMGETAGEVEARVFIRRTGDPEAGER